MLSPEYWATNQICKYLERVSAPWFSTALLPMHVSATTIYPYQCHRQTFFCRIASYCEITIARCRRCSRKRFEHSSAADSYLNMLTHLHIQSLKLCLRKLKSVLRRQRRLLACFLPVRGRTRKGVFLPHFFKSLFHGYPCRLRRGRSALLFTATSKDRQT